MSGVKISALPPIITPALSDVFAVVQGGVTYKETFTQLASLFVSIASLPLSVTLGGTGLSSTTSGELLWSPTNNTIANLSTGTGVTDFITTPSSANLSAALTTKITPTSGLAVFGLNWATTTTTVSLNGAGTAPVYSSNTLRWTQIGKVVFAEYFLTGDGGAEGSGAGQIRLTLPVSVANNSGITYQGVLGQANNGTTDYYLVPRFNINSAVDLYYQGALNTVPVALTGDDQNNVSREINLKLCYEVA